jgi:hypothetical protein
VYAGKSVVAGFGIPEGTDNNQPPALVFNCGENGCSLAVVRMADGRGWKFKTISPKPYGVARVEVLRLGVTP